LLPSGPAAPDLARPAAFAVFKCRYAETVSKRIDKYQINRYYRSTKKDER